LLSQAISARWQFVGDSFCNFKTVDTGLDQAGLICHHQRLDPIPQAELCQDV
jgi:hypothetical protein